MTKSVLTFMFIFLTIGSTKTCSAFGQEKIIVPPSQKAPNHDSWDILLKKYVDNDGNVAYKSFKNDIDTLNTYLANLAKNYPSDNWSKDEKLAYYINLYNAATIKLILDNYPLKSIKDIRFPWLKKRIMIGNDKWSLGGVEHKILRKMNEPRIHFAINCASYSCPKLLNEAYTSENMESQLEKATANFFNDSSKNIITSEKVQLSKIFKWYDDDFTENNKLIDYISTTSGIKLSKDTTIEYLDYNWNLNEKK